MPTASYSIGPVQASGLRFVTETHRDDFGVVVAAEYLADATIDYAAVMNARAVSIAAAKVAQEIDRNIAAIRSQGRNAVLTLKYSVRADNISALREVWRDANREESVMIGDYFASLADAQLRSIFGKTQIQVETMRSNRLTPAANTAANIKTAAGE